MINEQIRQALVSTNLTTPLHPFPPLLLQKEQNWKFQRHPQLKGKLFLYFPKTLTSLDTNSIPCSLLEIIEQTKPYPRINKPLLVPKKKNLQLLEENSISSFWQADYCFTPNKDNNLFGLMLFEPYYLGRSTMISIFESSAPPSKT